ncbi:hypothetical protein [uncultured Bacteroides sp.]|uniref:hypothetical protein n=1 Tax=uncultured Bacteroides sp. TaxID=162156 RepID=UPI00259568A9|nr:hypothetical protein [uncultured Bacteroides sp.]
MPDFLEQISQQELGQRMQNDMPLKGLVTFENQKSVPLEIAPLGTLEIESAGIGTFGLISVSDSVPIWVNNPNTIIHQEADTAVWHGYASNTITAAGSLSSIVELSQTNKTLRFYKNGQFSPKLYNGWNGGSRARIKTYKVTSLAKNAGKKIFFIGVAVDVAGVATGEISVAKGVTNTVVAGAAILIGGWIGLAIGLVYWGLDSMGVFDHHITGNSSQQDLLKQPIDNLRVVLPVRPLPQKQIIRPQYTPKQTYIGPAPAKRY